MGILKLFNKPEPKIVKLPTGSFTVDRDGHILACTLGSAYPEELVAEVARQVLHAFAEALEARLPLTEIIIQFKGLKITARELRGGAMVFFTPKTHFTNNSIAA